MTDCTKKNARCWATWTALVLWCLTCGGNGQKNGFRGGAKSYEIHVEANTIGTNLHYKLPEAKVKAAGKAKEDWLVDNDNAEMSSVNSPLLAVVSVKHPKFSTKGAWPGYKLKFKVPKDVSESGAKKTNFIRPALGEKRMALATQEDSSGMGQSALGSGSDLNPPAQNEDQLPIKLRNSKTKQDLQSVKKLTESSKQRSSRQSRQTTEESNSTGGDKEQHAEFPKSGSSLQMVAGLLSPLEKLKNLRLKNPTIDNEMAMIVAHAKKVVSEAKTVLKDAASFVSNVKSLVHGGKNMQLNGIADYARKAVEEVGAGELGGLLRESTAIAKGAAVTGVLRAVARHAAKPVKHAGPHATEQDRTSEKSTKEAEKDSKSGIGVATKTIEPNREVMAAADANNDLNHDGSASGENTQPKTADGKRRRRESQLEGEDDPESVENFFLSLNNLKDLLGLRRKSIRRT